MSTPNKLKQRETTMSQGLADPVDEANTIGTTPDRAREIARLTEFSLGEFIELTGVPAGEYGIYQIGRDRITLTVTGDAALRGVAATDQPALLVAEKQLTLDFPCTPARFQDWYNATCGINGVSDFPVAPAFLKELAATHEEARAQLGKVRSSTEIIDVFKVKGNDGENKKWWKDRMRSAKKYGLTDARASSGRAKRESFWYPTVVASWLIEKSHLSRPTVLQALKRNFPDADTSYL